MTLPLDSRGGMQERTERLRQAVVASLGDFLK
jgi:hypothetical protein